MIGLTMPILGGSWQAFDNLFGDNNCCYLNGWDYQGPYGPTFTGTIEAGDNATSQPNNPLSRVTGIDTNPHGSSQTWTVAQVQAMQGQFMPPDAKLMSTKPVYLGDLVVGSEKTYSSGMLARTLPAAYFVDANGKSAQPGVFYVYLEYHSTDTTQFDQCALGTDESFVLQPY